MRGRVQRAACLAALGLSLTAQAVPPPEGVAPVLAPAGGFGIDGDLLANTPVSGVGDWLPGSGGGGGGAVLDANGVPLNPATTFHFIDPWNSSSDNTFAGGLKWTDDPNTWQWGLGKASSKTDINNVLVHIAVDASGHSWVIIAADRFSASGDSYIDFELLQNSLIANANGTFTSAGPNGGRTLNDLLLSLAFTSGGSVADFFAWQWQTNGIGGFVYVDATASLPVGRVFVAANTNTVAVPFGAFGQTNYGPSAFVEAAVDLTALLGNFDPCLSVGFKTIMVKTKSSQSSTATISDFIDPIQYSLRIGPSAYAGPDQTQCAQGSETAFLLQGQATAGLKPIASTTWSVVSGVATIDAPNSLSTTARVASITATLRLTATQSNGCAETSDVVLTVAPLPVCSIAGPSAVCPLSSSQFSAPAGMSGYSWSVAGNATISGPTNTQTVTVIAASLCGTNFTLGLNVFSNNCSSACTADVTVGDTVPPSISAPPDAVLTCPADTSTNATGVASAQDDCGSVTITYSDSVTNGCGGTRVIARTWTASDLCGNSASAIQTITVRDITPPSLTPPANLVLECPADTSTNRTGVAVAQGRCSLAVVSYSDVVSNGCGGTKVVVRTWLATDACGNTASALQTITVRDTTPPTITAPPSVVLECPADTTTNNTGAATAHDGCGSATVSYSDVVSNSCGATKLIARTWTAIDDCGNSAQALQTITVRDTTPPTISPPPNLLLECPADTRTNVTGVATAQDGCSSVSINYSDSVSNSCAGTKVIARTWTATDACGNHASAIQTITVQDTTLPSITAPPNLVLECPADTSTNATGVATAQDVCSAVSLSYSDVVSNSCGGTKVIARTWMATDACGNSANAVQIITVRDTTPPSLSLPPNVVMECPVTDTSTNVTGVATAQDGCSSVLLSYSDIVSNTCGGARIVTRTWTATDACGNVTNAIQTITVRDTTPPSLTVPANVVLECPANTTTNNTGVATATDTCGLANVTFSDIVSNICGGAKVISRLWTATDQCGNSTNRVQTITVQNTNPPTITVPPDVTVDCSADTSPSGTGTATAQDGCSAVTVTYSDVVSNICIGSKIITRTWTATDGCGNSVSRIQTITALDLTAPSMSLKAPDLCTFSQGGWSGGGYPASLLPQYFTNVFPSGVTLGIYDPANGNSVPNGLFWQPNAAGLSALQSAMSVGGGTGGPISQDALDPTGTFGAGGLGRQTLALTCNIAFNEAGLLGGTATNYGSFIYTNSGSDSLNGMTVSQILGAANQALAGLGLPAGYDFSALDGMIDSLNIAFESCTMSGWAASHLLTPVLVVQCPSEVPPPNPALVSASGHCGSPVTITSLPDVLTNYNCPGQYTIRRTFMARDDCGNSNTLSYFIQVSNATPPSLTCPPDMVLQCPADTGTNQTGVATAQGACGAATVSYSDVVSNACGGARVVARTWTASDGCLTTNRVQTITVLDTAPPTITAPPSLVLECPADTSTNNTGVAMAQDGCSAVTLVYSDVVSNSCGGAKVIARTWTASDACGNLASALQNITVRDTTPPTITCALVDTLLSVAYTAGGSSNQLLEANYVSAFPDGILLGMLNTTNSDAAPYALNWEPNSAGLTALEIALAQVSSPAGPLVQSATNPTNTFGGGGLARQALALTLNIGFNTSGALGAGPNNFGSLVYTNGGDSLDGLTVNQILQAANQALAGLGLPPGYDYSALAVLAGQINRAFSKYAISSWATNHLSTPRLVVQCAGQVPPPDPAHVTAADGCSTVTVTNLPDAISGYTCPNRYLITRTWVARDACGNSSSVDCLIQVNDTTAPVLIINSNQTVLAGQSWSFDEPAATDNCGTATVRALSTVTNLTSTNMVVTRTWEATDSCGNASTGQQSITVVNAVSVPAPIILTPPQCQTVGCGNNMLLTVTPEGTGPFAYQWRFDGNRIAGATNSSLNLSALQFTNAGLYSVVVSNPGGSIVSPAAVVNVAPVLAVQRAGKGMSLTWPAPFILQVAARPAGPYTDIPGATSPCLPNTGAALQRDFRLRSPDFQLTTSYLQSGQAVIEVAGAPGINYILQASTDLSTWVNLQTNTAPSTFVDSNAWEYPMRMYRAVLAR